MFFVSKKKYVSLQKEFDDWKEGRKKSLLEEAGVGSLYEFTMMAERNQALDKKNSELSAELQKYKILYVDELQKRIELADKLKAMEEKDGG
jgi:hypothetical protein